MKREWRGEGGELLVYACLAGFKDHERKLLLNSVGYLDFFIDSYSLKSYF